MGSCLGSCFGACFGSCALGACTNAMSCACRLSNVMSNVMYVLLVVATVVASLALRYSNEDLNVGSMIGTQPSSICPSRSCDGIEYAICNSLNCVGYWAVYRMCFALSGFFVVMMALTACKSRWSSTVHRCYWFAKLTLFCALVAAALFAPNAFFAGFAWLARVLAPFFVVYQLVCFIDFGYATNELLVDKDDAEEPFFCLENAGAKWKGLMLCACGLLYAGAAGGVVALYMLYPQEGCPFTGAAIGSSWVASLLNTALSISPVAEHGTLFVSALVSAYSTYLAYATISAFPEGACNPGAADGTAETGWLVASCIITALSIAYVAFSAGRRQVGANVTKGTLPAEVTPGDSAGVANDAITVHVAGGGKGADATSAAPDAAADADDEDDPLLPRSYLSYHFTLLLAAAYTAMLVTDWGVPSTAQNHPGVGYASAWLLMAANWTCQLLYFWTLIAAKACPHRDFS